MTPRDVVRHAIPGAPDDVCDYIVWNLTPFPFRVSAREIYAAARRFVRAQRNGVTMCDWCNRRAQDGQFVCVRCARGLEN